MNQKYQTVDELAESLAQSLNVRENLLSVQELAESLNVPCSWIYARTRQTGPSTIPRIRVGKYVRFELDKVMAWLKKQNERE